MNIVVEPSVEAVKTALRLVASLGGGGPMFGREVTGALLDLLGNGGRRITERESLDRLATLLWALAFVSEVTMTRLEREGVDRLDLMALIESGAENFDRLRASYPDHDSGGTEQ